jgi:hypothetical protein
VIYLNTDFTPRLRELIKKETNMTTEYSAKELLVRAKTQAKKQAKIKAKRRDKRLVKSLAK